MKLMKMMSLGLALLVLGGISKISAQADCGGTDSTPADLETLRVLTTVPVGIGFPPWSFRSDDTASGLAADIACELRKRLGYENVVFVNNIGANLLTDLNAGTGALAISHISITDENLAQAAFVKYNDDNDESLVFRGTPSDAFDSLPDLCAQGARVGVISGQREAGILAVFPNCDADFTTVQFDTLEEALSALSAVHPAVSPAIDALFINTPTSNSIVAGNNAFTRVTVPNADISFAPVTRGIGIAVNNECCQLYANVLVAINAMIADGRLQELRDFWKTGTFTQPNPALPIPTSCNGTLPTAEVIVRNAIAEFIFDKFCPCPEGQEIVEAV